MLTVIASLVGEPLSPNIVNAAGNIAPLVTSAELKVTTVLLVEDPEIVRLERLIREFSETHSL